MGLNPRDGCREGFRVLMPGQQAWSCSASGAPAGLRVAVLPRGPQGNSQQALGVLTPVLLSFLFWGVLTPWDFPACGYLLVRRVAQIPWPPASCSLAPEKKLFCPSLRWRPKPRCA